MCLMIGDFETQHRYPEHGAKRHHLCLTINRHKQYFLHFLIAFSPFLFGCYMSKKARSSIFRPQEIKKNQIIL